MDRKIKSFVRRNSKIPNSKQQALIDYWDLYGIVLTKDENILPQDGIVLSQDSMGHTQDSIGVDLIDFHSIFRNNNPIILEIGFGNGESLLKMAQENHNTNFIGIEVYKAGIGNVCQKAYINNLKNIKVICGDATEVLANNIYDNTFKKVQLFFPDPWPKKRHQKRRIIRNNFVNLVASKLLPGGIFHLATDWEHYAFEMLKTVDSNMNFNNLNGAGNYSPLQCPNRPPTKFEVKGIKLGHKVFDLEYCCVKDS